MRAQLLDSMDLERERGITIKAQAVRVLYEARDGETYQLHLIDTPGPRRLHLRGLPLARGVRGRAARRRRLAGRRGADARQHLPRGRRRARADPVPEQDRPAGRRARARRRRGRRAARRAGRRDPADLAARRARASSTCSSSSSRGSRRPPATRDAPPRALIFDSEFDQYRGVDRLHPRRRRRLPQGRGDPRDGGRHRGRHRRHRLLHAGDDAGRRSCGAGEVGYLITGIKDVTQLRVGDTLTTQAPRAPTEALPGYRDVKPMVFCGLFPIDSDDYPDLRDALEKLTLNDAALLVGARDLRRARLRLPLRLPRPAAHGHRARAPGARVRPRADGDDAVRRASR